MQTHQIIGFRSKAAKRHMTKALNAKLEENSLNNFPSYWDCIDNFKTNQLIMIDLNPAHSEFLNIKNEFAKTLPTAQITRVVRI